MIGEVKFTSIDTDESVIVSYDPSNDENPLRNNIRGRKTNIPNPLSETCRKYLTLTRVMG